MEAKQRLYIANLRYGPQVDNIYFSGDDTPIQAQKFNDELAKSKDLAAKDMPWAEFRAAFIKVMADAGFVQTAK